MTVSSRFSKVVPFPHPPSCDSSKRSKTADSNTPSDTQTHHVDSSDENDIQFIEPEWPIGKKKGKRQIVSSSSAVSSEEISKLLSDLSNFRSNYEEYNTRHLEQHERWLQTEAEKHQNERLKLEKQELKLKLQEQQEQREF